MCGSQYKVNVCTQLSILLTIWILENRKSIHRKKNCPTNKIMWLKKKEEKKDRIYDLGK